jgi:sterol desaturase/sphingolipid hydroxylase (fatty acid hydroxylase superfamily)
MDATDLRHVRILLYAVFGIAIIASFIEAFVLWWLKRPYDFREAAASLVVTAGRLAFNVVPLAIAFPTAAWLYEHRIWSPTLDSFAGLAVLFIGIEFFYYWFHRGSHRIRWFWANHAVHHSPNSINFSAAYRLGWTSRIGGSLLFFLPLAWLGYQPEVIVAAFAVNLLYQFWIHAEWIPKLGPLEGILNTPSAHRVHHASNLEYLDANYGGVLMIFDRMFGTYIAERDDLPCRYGLVTPLRTYNPLKIAFFYWVEIFRDLRKARSLRDVAGYLFGPPGWAPDGNGPTTENMRKQAGLLQEPELHGIPAAR